MSDSDSQLPVDQVLEVDRADFVIRLGVIAKSEGVGRMPIVFRYDGQDLVLTYGCTIRVKATGTWSEEAHLSKAALKQFIKNFKGPRQVTFSGRTRATVDRFVSGLGNPPTVLHLVRQGDKTLLINGHPIPCIWSRATEI